MTEKELDQYQFRKKKLERLLKQGFNPYPSQTKRSHSLAEILLDFETLAANKKKVVIAGRLLSLRLHGGSLFFHLDDGTERLQNFMRKDEVGEEKYQLFIDDIDIGDFIETQGELFVTKKGEKTLKVSGFNILAKALRPLPEKWHGLTDTEIRFRQRYLDLISNPEIKGIFRKRSQIITSIREFLNSHGFLEVDTPILQPIPGGANARPFVTHHNALDIDLYLRIAPELYLKRLIVGGFEKVYEISRCFRNEGVDYSHNPEFTQVEFYWAFADYEELMKFTEIMLLYILKNLDADLILDYSSHRIDFTPPYLRITFNEALKKYAHIDLDKNIDLATLKTLAEKAGLKIDKGFHKAKILDELFKKIIRPNLTQPTFVKDYPYEISPLSKRMANNPRYTERFQLVAAGLELCNAFSELNDPQDQLARFKEQEILRREGDTEAQRIDLDFIEALEYGMPPTAGFGLGIDRLTALLTNSHNIKEVIFFPTLKPKDSLKTGEVNHLGKKRNSN
ncbi:MAG: lysine--tRNA ligase [Patescibacteria group bacterium]